MKVYPVIFYTGENRWVQPHTSLTDARKFYNEKSKAYDDASDDIKPKDAPVLYDPLDYDLNKGGILKAFKDAQALLKV